MDILEVNREIDYREVKCQYCKEHIPIQFFRGLDVLEDSLDIERCIEDYTWTPNFFPAYMRGQKGKVGEPC